MPKRTNDFQELVTLIHKALAPKGATITESVMVKAPEFGDLREIDVLLESDVGPFQIKIAIEAKDHKRKLSITDIEAIIGKYRASGALIVDKVVLVSRRGFSNQAAAKAKVNGIELLTLSEAHITDWSSFLPANIPRLPESLHLNIPPHVANLRLKPLGHTPLPHGNQHGGQIICRCHRTKLGSPSKYASHVLECHFLRNESFRLQFSEVLKTQRKVCCRVRWPMARYLLLLGDKEIELAEMSFHIHATSAVAPLEFKSYELDGESIEKHFVQHATADVAGQKIEFVMPNGFSSKQMIVKFGKWNPS